MFTRRVLPGSTSSLTIVDHSETYGRHILEKAIHKKRIDVCIDIGCGGGDDLSIVLKHHANTKVYGFDFGSWNDQKLKSKGINSYSINIENEKFPFNNESVDFIIANQVMEHTKEIFWINHEVFRTLKIGGYFFMGTPNVLSFHNRILMALGNHPTQHKLLSAHVRPFSKKDVQLFYKQLGDSFCKVDHFWGSQFYPFPKYIARLLSSILPSHSFSIFFLIRKTGVYTGEFLNWPKIASLETNFYVGN